MKSKKYILKLLLLVIVLTITGKDPDTSTYPITINGDEINYIIK